jgi:putative flippase GtrA
MTQLTMNSLVKLVPSGSGLTSQGVRYALAGAFVGGVYVSATTLFAVVVQLPFKVALGAGFVLQLAVHFTLQRRFVWRSEDGFALRFRHQAYRYLAVAAAQLGVTALSTSLVPRAVGLSTEIVYLVTVAALTVANFLLFRNVVFHRGRGGWANESGGDTIGRESNASVDVGSRGD